MQEDFTIEDYVSAFSELEIADYQKSMLQEHYYAPNRTLTAKMLAKAMGFYSYPAANLHYGILGRLVCEKLEYHPQYKLESLVKFEKRNQEWHWEMLPHVAKALEKLGWVEYYQLRTPGEIDENEKHSEGAVRKVLVNVYERNPVARKKCIQHYECKCAVCGVVLADVYGDIAEGFIHVHHLRQLSEINEEYQVDPIKDLRPVCPTCHAIIHLGKITRSIEEVKDIYNSHR